MSVVSILSRHLALLIGMRSMPSTCSSPAKPTLTCKQIECIYLHIGVLLRGEEPPYGNDQTDTCADAERVSRTNLVERCTAGKTSSDETGNSQDLMISRCHQSADIKKLRVSHELTPCRRKCDCMENPDERTANTKLVEAHL
jgi:hypothetical protein